MALSFYKVKHYSIMMIMVLSLRRCFGATTTKNGKVSPSPASVPNTRMPVLNALFQPSCILWHGPSWFITSIYRTERGSDDLSLWSFTVKFLDWVYNQVPNVRSGLTPLELITRERSDYKRHPPLSCVGLSSVCP